MWTRIARIILRNKIALLTLVAVATGFMLFKASTVGISYQFSRILPVHDTVYTTYLDFQKTFGETSNTIVIATNQDLFTPENVQAWKSLSTSLESIDGVERALNLTNMPRVVFDEPTQKLDFVPLVARLPKNQAQADSLKALFDKQVFLKGRLVSEDGQLHLMLVQLHEDHLYNKNIIRIVEAVKGVVADTENSLDWKLFVSGLPHIRMANTKKIEREVYLFIVLTLFITTLILFLFLKSVRATLISLVVVVIGVIFSFGLISVFDYRITLLSSLIPPLVIVIGIPNCIFLINKYHTEFKFHGYKIMALQRVIRKIGNVTLLTNVTTALGFAAFILTDSEALVEFGVVASINILTVFLLSLILIPIMYTYMPEPRERHYKHLDQTWLQRFIDFLSNTVENHRKKLYVVTIAVVAVAIFGITLLRTTGNLTDDFSKSDPVYTELKMIERHFRGVVPMEIVVTTDTEKGVTKAFFLNKLSQLQSKLDSFPQLSKSLSIADFIKVARQGFYEGNPDFYDLPTRQDRDWVMGAIPRKSGMDGFLGALTDSTQTQARISLQVADISSPEMKILRQKVEDAVREIFPPEEFPSVITGSSVLFLKGTHYLIKNLILSLSLAILVISIIMAFLFGSARMVFISIIPNLIPLVLTAGIMGYFGIPLKPSTILVFSIAFGISVDDTIHYLAKYRQELKSNGWQMGKAVHAAIRETGVSMFYTSIVLFFGFSIFIWSEFGGTVALGILVSITLLFAMFTNLLFLPGLLLSLEKYITSREFSENIIDVYTGEEESLENEKEPSDMRL